MAKTNTNHRLFFATFFDNEERYEEKQVNGWWLIRRWDGNANQFTIDLFSEESYRNYLRGKSQFKERADQMSFLKSL